MSKTSFVPNNTASELSWRQMRKPCRQHSNWKFISFPSSIVLHLCVRHTVCSSITTDHTTPSCVDIQLVVELRDGTRTSQWERVEWLTGKYFRPGKKQLNQTKPIQILQGIIHTTDAETKLSNDKECCGELLVSLFPIRWSLPSNNGQQIGYREWFLHDHSLCLQSNSIIIPQKKPRLFQLLF
jgi:hypothetical protein